MKYFKDFKKYLFEYRDNNIIGKTVLQTGTNILSGSFSSLFGSFSATFRKIKLEMIKSDYDKYLSIVYKQYLDTQEDKNTPQDSIQDKSKIEDSEDVESMHKDFIKPKVDNTDYDKKNEDEEDFSNFDLDIDELEGLMYHSTSAEELSGYIKELKELENLTEKELEDLYQEVHNSDDSNHASKVEQKILVREQRLSRIKKLLKVKPKTNENNSNWRAGAIEPPTWWLDSDKTNVTNLINPYKIEEIYLKKESYCDDKKNGDKLKRYWSDIENEIFMKWNYIFNIDNLRTKGKTVETKSKLTKEKMISLVSLDVLHDEIGLSEIHPNQAVNNNFYIVSILNDGLHIVLYKIDIHNERNMFKVAGVIKAKDGSNEKNVLLELAKLPKTIVTKKKSVTPYFGDDGYSLTKIIMDGNGINLFFSNEKDNKLGEYINKKDALIHKVSNNREITNLIGNAKLPQMNNNISQNIMDAFMIKNKK